MKEQSKPKFKSIFVLCGELDGLMPLVYDRICHILYIFRGGQI